MGLPWWLSWKESSRQSRRRGFNPWSGKIPHATEELSPCATATEPVLYSLGATATEPTSCNYGSLCALMPMLWNKRRPPHWETCGLQLENSSHSSQLEKSLCSNKDPEHAHVLSCFRVGPQECSWSSLSLSSGMRCSKYMVINQSISRTRAFSVSGGSVIQTLCLTQNIFMNGHLLFVKFFSCLCWDYHAISSSIQLICWIDGFL